jgi:hypothetical protein
MGCPGSRAKVEFNSWQTTGAAAENTVEQTTIKTSLEGVI